MKKINLSGDLVKGETEYTTFNATNLVRPRKHGGKKMRSKSDRAIGTLMRLYRHSPFHSPQAGTILERILAIFLQLKRTGTVLKEIDGINFELDLMEMIDSSLYFSNTFEEREEKLILSILTPGMTVLDIGANIGYHTFRMARLVQPGGLVYAIEPSSWAYKKLQHNASLNPNLNNIRFLKLGLSDKDIGRTNIYFQSSYRIDGHQNPLPEEVLLSSLDTVVSNENIQKIDFIKMDVDGYEGKVIRGAMTALSSFRPTILMEITPSAMLSNGDDPEELVGALQSLGYRFETTKRIPIPNLSAYYNSINILSMFLAIPQTTNSRVDK
jgi:FkbM family methyltransferase